MVGGGGGVVESDNSEINRDRQRKRERERQRELGNIMGNELPGIPE